MVIITPYSHASSHSGHFFNEEDAQKSFDIFMPLRRWIDGFQVSSRKLARLICRVIPNRCPFEREVTLFGRTILRIPALCKLNPVYNELINMRSRALIYLADICGEDVTEFIC